MLPEIGLAKGACSLWEEELLFDYTIEVEDEQFKVHKVVMASVSDYFKAMLTGGMMESREDRVRLEGLSSLAVRNVIAFIYTGDFGSSQASLEDRLMCATYLQIPAAVKLCTASLCEKVDKENCFRILTLFKSHGIADGIDHTVKFMKHNIEDILDYCKSEDLTYEEFLNLMDCWGKSEWQLFTLAMHWLKKDHAQRKGKANEIMSRIRFCLMSPTELGLIISMKGMVNFSEADASWYNLVEKALRYHDLPIHQKVVEESEQSKVRTEPSPVCFGLHSSVAGQLFTIHQGKSWTHYGTVDSPVLNDYQDRSLHYININQFLIVSVNSGEDADQCSLFDPKTLTWSAMASMGIPRKRCALAYHDKHLYALGGRVEPRNAPTDVIEKYDFHTNTWSAITSKMPVALRDHNAFSIGGFIYIFGITNLLEFSNILHCFDPETSVWSEKGVFSTHDEFTNMVCVEIDGEKVIAYIDEHIKLHYFKPSVDKWLLYKQDVPSELRIGNFGCLHATGNTIYLVDFEHDEDDEVDLEPPHICEKWTFGEYGLRIDSEIPMLTDDTNPGRTHFTRICGLLSIIPPSVRRGSAALP